MIKMIKFHKYLLLFMLLYTASLIYAQYSPKPRFAHTSILVDSKLYFIGGFDSMGKSQSDFFYLDLSIPFSTEDMNTLKYMQLNNNGLTPNARCTITTINNMIYLFGCFMINDNSSLVYQYSISSDKWTIPSFNGSSPAHRISNVVAADPSTGSIYYFGGKDDAYNILNDTWIFSTNNNQLSWQQITSAPQPICCSPAILLPDGYILYISGSSLMNKVRVISIRMKCVFEVTYIYLRFNFFFFFKFLR
jgi:N-acetylneuraminic acid mutarotase